MLKIIRSGEQEPSQIKGDGVKPADISGKKIHLIKLMIFRHT
jgi:hypothetical protein